MRILIPTYGRTACQTTFDGLPDAVRRRVNFVVQHRELAAWKARMFPSELDMLIVLPPSVRTIAATRQWLLDNLADTRVLMLDDDLTFYRRRDDDPTRLRAPTTDELHEMFQLMEDMLDQYAHAGVAAREGANRNVVRFVQNTRIMRVLGYRFDVLRREGIRFDRLSFMEDFDVALQLLRKGYDNCLINWYAQNQRSSNAPGGCSTYRTIEAHNYAAEGLAALHPEFVKAVKKQTKTAWGGQERTDVIIQWKAARQSGGPSRLLDQRKMGDIEATGEQ